MTTRWRPLSSDADKAEQAAYNYALRLLAGREQNRRALKQKLAARGYETAVIASVLDRLVAADYLSETRFAESFIRSRINKGEAPWLAAKRAREKGAEASAVERALAAAEAEFDAEASARALIESRDPAGRRFEEQRVWQRQARFLQSKGYRSEVILRVLHRDG